MWFSPTSSCGATRSRSGRTTAEAAPVPTKSHSARSSRSPTRSRQPVPSLVTTSTSITLATPMKSATKRVAGPS